MSGKIYDVYVNVNTEENVFYSAYLKTKVQYNDVDPNKRIEIHNVEGNEDRQQGQQERTLEEPKNDQIEVASVNNI